MNKIGTTWRRFLCWLFGTPVCRGCEVHMVDCVGWCKESDAERTVRYIEGID